MYTGAQGNTYTFMDIFPLFSVITQRELLPAAHSSPRSAAPSASAGDEGAAEKEERGRDRAPAQMHTHSLRRNGTLHHPRAANPDPSCLLTPPNTPLYPEDGGAGPGPAASTNGCSGRTVAECKKTNGLISNGLEGRLKDTHDSDEIQITCKKLHGIQRQYLMNLQNSRSSFLYIVRKIRRLKNKPFD